MLVSEEMVKAMKPGAVIVDIAVDQGGCVATTRPTTLLDPVYSVHGVLHYAVTNMPALVPRTSTFALTNATLAYALDLARKGPRRAAADSAELAGGVNVWGGRVVHPAVAAAIGEPAVSLADLPEV
jgi:alanine dehydrogenase